MQRLKKFIAVFVTMVMVMATGVVGFGATQGQAKLTVKLAGDNISGVNGTATAYRLMDWDGANYNFNTDNGDVLKEALNMKGIADDEVKEKLSAMKDEDQDVKKLAEDLYAKKSSLTNGAEITITNGQGTVEGLDFGYYFLVYDGGNNNVQRALVELTEDMEVTLKTEELVFTKDIDSYSHEVGENIKYTLTTEVPDKNSITTFKIKDTLSKGLKFATETAEGENKGKLKVSIVIGNGSPTDKFIAVTNNGSNDSFELDLSNVIANASTGDKIIITYNAKIKVDGDRIAPNEENKAILTYNTKEIEDTENTYTYPIYIRKIDEKDEAKILAGAKFELHEKDGNTNRLIALDKLDNGIYTVNREREGKSTDSTAETIATSLEQNNVNGYNLKINGLKADKEYLLVETAAPADGYNKLKNPITITIKPNADNKGLWSTEVNNNDGKQSITEADNIIDVKNGKGGLLPETGGMGTIIFTIVGLGLILAALGMRKTKKEQ